MKPNPISRLRIGAAGALALLLASAPAAAGGSLCFFEGVSGAPGTTAFATNGLGQQADVDFDASSAEGGGLSFGPTEIELRPTGSVVLLDFSCALAGCDSGDYVFSPGGEGAGSVVVSDPDLSPKQGVFDLGTVTYDAPSGEGSLELVRCNYVAADMQERTCSPFTVVSLPEPGGLALLAGAALLFGPLRRARGANPGVRS